MSKPILYDLGIALGSITLWLTPLDATRALGYSLSVIFSARAYYMGICSLNKERKEDEVQGIQYEASLDFYERLVENHIDSALEIAATNIETRTLEKLVPLLQHKRQLERQAFPVHPELSDEEKEQAARNAIETALSPNDSQAALETDESVFRAAFPEQMDAASWKAILKALQVGSSRDEIVKDVLGCSEQTKDVGRHYFEFLKGRFMA